MKVTLRLSKVTNTTTIAARAYRISVFVLPLWVPIVLGFQGRPLTKWTALPLLVFWLTISIFIGLLLVGWARIVTGNFSPTEVAMTLVVGAGSIAGLFAGGRWRTAVRPATAFSVFLLFGALQFLAVRLSLIPYITRL